MKHIPNVLSAIRILLIPFFVWQLLAGHPLVAGILLLVSGITDLLDGMLARRFGWISDLGKVLDPVADKLTQITVSVMLLISLRQYWPVFVILLAKEAVMLILGSQLILAGVKIEGAKWFGKLATGVFYAVMITLLIFPSLPVWAETMLLAAVLVTSLLAGAMYIPEYRRYRKEKRAAAGAAMVQGTEPT